MKLKTHKSAVKRVKKITKVGQFLVRSLSAQHRTTGKSKRVLQKSKKFQSLSKATNKMIKKLLPNI